MGAAGQVLGAMEVEWLACRVSAVADKWSFAWLAAYSQQEVVPVDLVLVGPARLRRSRADYAPAQLDLLRLAPDSLLGRAPVAIADALAEDAALRAWLAERGVTYSALVKPSALRGISIRGHRVPLAGLLEDLRGNAKPGSHNVTWAVQRVALPLPDGGALTESLIAYWHEGRLVSVVLTNERDRRRLDRIFDPTRVDFLARPRPRMPWRRTTLRDARAWEHHLALLSVLHAFRVSRRH